MPRGWGWSQQKFLDELRDEWIKVVFMDGKVIKGVLIGVDKFDIFIQPVNEPKVMISKGGIRYLHQTAEGNGEG